MKWVCCLLLVSAVCAAYDPSVPYQVPTAYEADMEFHLPYIGLTEPVYVYVDQAASRQRLEYYSGMDVYMFAASGTSYSVVPVGTDLTCLFHNASAQEIVNIFPDLTKFAKQSGQQIITTRAFPNGVKCDMWSYSYGTIGPNAQGNATSMQPDAEGYAGNYTFFVSADTGTPVQFQIRGHNVVLGGSHSDEYTLDYLSIVTLKSVPSVLFQPPSGMPCHANDNPFGPTYVHGDGGNTLPAGLVRSNPLTDLHMMFPEGAAMREKVFADYERAHNKQYTSDDERNGRKAVFHSNLRYINAANRRGKLYHVAPNHLADWTEQERRGLLGYRNDLNTDLRTQGRDDILGACGLYSKTGVTQPAEVDWRALCPPGSAESCLGLVLPAKDQGTCGSCWTYGATGAIEAAWAKKTGSLVSLSQQNLIDCTWKYGVQGCGGGSDFIAYAWLLDHNKGQIAEAESYGGYMNQDGFCHFDWSTNPPNNINPWTGKTVEAGAMIQTCWHVTQQWNCSDQCVSNKDAVDILSDALASGNVVSVAIDATQPDFYFYHSGYYYSDQCLNGNNDLDHQVLAVGYTQGPDGNRYTIIRNSWSDHWGEKGYVKISQVNNNCGVGTQATFIVA